MEFISTSVFVLFWEWGTGLSFVYFNHPSRGCIFLSIEVTIKIKKESDQSWKCCGNSLLPLSLVGVTQKLKVVQR